ncbi:MAG: YihY/virulence factor BrkB family protein [Kamptonema sp. SIO4C4]|nr:YihY/virulence factor BrkB family protein [Kamptonema sp. SIO4C4]
MGARLRRFLLFFFYLNRRTVGTTIASIFRHRFAGLAAEIAYNAMLAFFPAILTLITAISLFEENFAHLVRNLLIRFMGVQALENESVQSTLRDLATNFRIVAPDLAWQLLTNFVDELTQVKSTSLFSVSFIAAIWISSSALGAAMNALDQIHQLPRRKRRPFWKAKLVSILLTLASIFLLVIASFLVLIGGSLVRFVSRMIEYIPLQESERGARLLLQLWQTLNWPLAFTIVILAFALIYRFAPSRWHKGEPILPGAILAALSWAGISALFRVYVENFGAYNKVYGAVGAVIVLMLWFYLTALVMLIGGQLNVTVGEAMRHHAEVRRKQQLLRSPQDSPRDTPSPLNE